MDGCPEGQILPVMTKGESEALNKRLQRSKQFHGRNTRWANSTPEREMERKRKHALRMAKRRASETPEEAAERRRKNAERQRRKRREIREIEQSRVLNHVAAVNADNLENENEQKRKDALAVTRRRASETPEQAAERRMRNNEGQKRKHQGMRETNQFQMQGHAADITGGAYSYVCHACNATFNKAMEYFNHVQGQSCLPFYQRHPEVLLKILKCIKSGLSEEPTLNPSSDSGNVVKAEREIMERTCDSCQKEFAIDQCNASDNGLSNDGPAFCEDCRVSRQCSTQHAVQNKSDTEESSGVVGTSYEVKSEWMDSDFLQGVVPLKRPLLSSALELPEYLCPLGAQFPIKSIRMPYCRAEPYRMHRCWECDKPIVPTTKRFSDHFKVLYECRWCVYKTHCEAASVDHVLRFVSKERNPFLVTSKTG